MLSAESQRPNALTAFKVSRRWFEQGRRIEMQELAAELDVSRATLFRWVGSRDVLLAEIIWSLVKPALRGVLETTSGHGPARVAAIMGGFAAEIDAVEGLHRFMEREPERALRLITTRRGTVQQRAVAHVENILRQEISPESFVLPSHELAYLLIRILESFAYTPLITGEPADPRRVEQATAALLRA
ncbi:MAG: TetR/AcrR family transcriptional regulator [Aldersonia sp.]|nr:TetR/AcrR family transcriptional regulator [Aldersonia sp.]